MESFDESTTTERPPAGSASRHSTLRCQLRQQQQQGARKGGRGQDSA